MVTIKYEYMCTLGDHRRLADAIDPGALCTIHRINRVFNSRVHT